MANRTTPLPQTEQKHPDEWNRDLNPNRMAGQNIGGIAQEHERKTRTAYDVKSVHRALDRFSDDELKQIPIVECGTRLRQGATYLDLGRGESLTATGGMTAERDQKLVPKDAVHYETWNKLLGEEKS